MLKKITLISFLTLFMCAVVGNAMAASAFDGKWYLDADKMAENDPEYAELKSNLEIWEQVKAEMSKGGIEVDVAKGQILETFYDGKPNPAKITVLSEKGNVLRVRGDGEKEVIVFRLVSPKELTMSLEGAEEEGTIYFKK